MKVMIMFAERHDDGLIEIGIHAGVPANKDVAQGLLASLICTLRDRGGLTLADCQECLDRQDEIEHEVTGAEGPPRLVRGQSCN